MGKKRPKSQAGVVNPAGPGYADLGGLGYTDPGGVYLAPEWAQQQQPQYAVTSIVTSPQPEAETKKKKKKSSSRMECIPVELKAIVALVTLGLAVFDIFTDVNVLRVFGQTEKSYLFYAMILVVFVSFLIFLLQLYAFYLRLRALCGCCVASADEEEVEETLDRREERYSCCNETTSYLLLVFEDGPAAGILVAATVLPGFTLGNDVDYCEVYNALFEDSFVGWLSLLASFVVACWKFVLSFLYCCACCCRIWQGRKSFCERCCCCFARILRPFFALGLFLSIFYIFFAQRDEKLVAQFECHNATGTAADAYQWFKGWFF